LEDRPRYSKSRCFDPFPFPDPVPDALKAQIRDAADELDATRKRVLDEHPDLTLTKLYNVLEKVKANDTLSAADEDIRDRGLVLILKELHETIDGLVFDAYGWPHDLTEDEILENLVALNKERANEEKRGLVRWLRPDYQIPKFGTPRQKAEQIEADLVDEATPEQKPRFPKSEVERMGSVFAALAAAEHPLTPSDLATRFKQGKQVEKQVALTLLAIARMGHLTTPDGGKAFALRGN
jgi:hypothetical protein